MASVLRMKHPKEGLMYVYISFLRMLHDPKFVYIVKRSCSSLTLAGVGCCLYAFTPRVVSFSIEVI